MYMILYVDDDTRRYHLSMKPLDEHAFSSAVTFHLSFTFLLAQFYLPGE